MASIVEIVLMAFGILGLVLIAAIAADRNRKKEK